MLEASLEDYQMNFYYSRHCLKSRQFQAAIVASYVVYLVLPAMKHISISVGTRKDLGFAPEHPPRPYLPLLICFWHEYEDWRLGLSYNLFNEYRGNGPTARGGMTLIQSKGPGAATRPP
jgi:hypothetical protein